MMWKALFTPRARKDLIKLEREHASRILEKIKKTLENPETHYKELGSRGYRKLRIGDYRVIAVLDFSGKVVDVRRVGHRRNIYKKI